MNDLMEQANWLMTAEAMWDAETVANPEKLAEVQSEATHDDLFPLFI